MLGLTRREAQRALRRDHRVRRARGVPRPPAQELLVGHERAARVLGRGPGRRRHPARRRGARRRRRRVPAEVLRAVRAAQARRARRSSSSRTTCPRSSASATARCCSSAATCVEIGEPHAIARAYNELNFGRLVHEPRPRTARYGDHAAAEIIDAWFEDDARRADHDARAGRAVHDRAWRSRFHAALDDPIFAFNLRNEPRHTVFATSTEWRAEPDRALRGRRRRVDGPRALRELARAEPLHAHARRSRAPAPAPTRSTCARTSRRCSCTARASTGGIADVPHTYRRRARMSTARARASGRASLGDDARRFWRLTWTLAMTDFKLRFYGSVLGYVWTLVRPFAFFGVHLLRLHRDRRRSATDVKNYAAYILFALVLFQFFLGDRRRLPAAALVDAREPAAQDALPAARDPAGGHARRAVRPRR